MGSRTPSVALAEGTRTFAVVRLEREWQPQEVSDFKTGLTLREQLFVTPVVSRVNPTEIIFRCDLSELVVVRRALDQVTPSASRALLEHVSAPSVDVAMLPGVREHI